MKVCSKCKQTKPLSEFYKRVDDQCIIGWRWFSACKVCELKRCKIYKATKRAKELAKIAKSKQPIEKIRKQCRDSQVKKRIKEIGNDAYLESVYVRNNKLRELSNLAKLRMRLHKDETYEQALAEVKLERKRRFNRERQRRFVERKKVAIDINHYNI